MKYNKPIGDDYVVKKDGRVLKPTGPRAMQLKAAMKAQESETVAMLKEQIKELMEIVASSKTANVVPSGYTAEDVDREINKAVEIAIVETEKKYTEKITHLEAELARAREEHAKYVEQFNEKLFSELNDRIKGLENNVTSLKVKVESKDEIIETLKNSTGNGDSELGEVMERLADKVDAIANTAFEGEEFVDDPNRPKLETQFIDPLSAEEVPDFEPHVNVDEEKVEPQGEKINDKVSKLRDILGK